MKICRPSYLHFFKKNLSIQLKLLDLISNIIPSTYTCIYHELLMLYIFGICGLAEIQCYSLLLMDVFFFVLRKSLNSCQVIKKKITNYFVCTKIVKLLNNCQKYSNFD